MIAAIEWLCAASSMLAALVLMWELGDYVARREE